MSQQLQHFSHEHPLMFKEEEQKNEDGEPISCSVCRWYVRGPSYSCNQCSELFIIHKSCAELPREMHHPVHNKHPLIHEKHPFPVHRTGIGRVLCDICGQYRFCLFSYRCGPCNFTIEPKCASNLSNIEYLEHFSHEHALIFVGDQERKKEEDRICQGCQEPDDLTQRLYRCSRILCRYYLHESCAHKMPVELRHPMHTEHPLILNKDRAKHHLCNACNQDSSGKFTYSCFQCDFHLDQNCAFTKHFSHAHPLMFKETEQNYEDGAATAAGPPIACSACGDPVLGPSYSCYFCPKFVLHKSCAELPREMHHPIHRKHSLILLSGRNYYCDICSKTYSGLFSYNCEPCDFDLDLQCASNLSDIKYLEHFSHEHALIFVGDQERQKKEDRICQGCQEPDDLTQRLYRCSRILCRYYLHESCAHKMPVELRHPMHTEHPLILNKDRAKHNLCNACNQDSNGKFTYSCFQCDFHLDQNCAFTKHFSHAHPLMFKETELNYEDGAAAAAAGPPVVCSACGDPVLSPSYRCYFCPKFVLHKSCAELPREMHHPIHRKHSLILLSGRNYYCDICRKTYSGLFSYKCKPCDFDLDLQCASNLSNIKYLEHFSHEHALIFVEDPEKREENSPVVCKGCQEEVMGPSYCCSRFRCHYTLHKSCVELPSEFNHSMHTQHPLILNKDGGQGCHCDACYQDCSRRFTYSCFKCNFNLDSKCAFNWTGFTHFSHEHPLLLEREPKKKYFGPLFCDGCRDQILGPSYTCINTSRRRKCGFNLHQKCAELPREINHPMHHQHRLFLLNHLPDIKVRRICNVCNEPCRFLYSCSICDFNLDLKCESNWQTIIADDSHEHQFIVLGKKKSDLKVNCDVCGEYWTTVYYMCSICQLLVHKECASLPRSIKKPDHQHQLKLTWFLDSPNPKNLPCNVCSISIDKCRAAYCCGECSSYVAHVACMTSEYSREESFWEVPLNDDESDNAPEITHFSHQHSLAANDPCKEVKDEHRLITCEGCIRPITATRESFYSCTKQEDELCYFFLHKVCAQLPKKMLLPQLHQHEFTLLSRAPSIGGVFTCYMCGTFNQGFTYTCEECASKGETVIYLDLQCIAYWDNKTLKHDSHVHRLFLNTEWDENVHCNGCGCNIYFCFSCKRCEYHLCIPCVRLPLIGWHRYDDHPLKLTYASVECNLGYYCQICEGKRDPKQWFYRCDDCDFDCHAHCILGRYRQVKLGSTCKHDDHQHPVTLVDKARSPIRNDKRENILPCEKCRQPCVELVFECGECNINIHREGFCQVTDLENSAN